MKAESATILEPANIRNSGRPERLEVMTTV
jgi:hypothetical protein